jgi:hypothetical protein
MAVGTWCCSSGFTSLSKIEGERDGAGDCGKVAGHGMCIGDSRKADVHDTDEAVGSGEWPEHLGSVLEIGDVEVLLRAHSDKWECRERATTTQLGAHMRVVEDRVLMQGIKSRALAEGAHESEEAVTANDVDGHLPRV